MIRAVALRTLATLAALGLLASAAVHLSTFFGWNPGEWIFLLHVGIFLVFIPAILFAGMHAKDRSPEARGKEMEAFWASIPPWLRGAIGLFGAYAVVNFVIFAFYLSEGGTPGEIDGKVVLHSHGKIIRELSPEEFDRKEAYVARGFSGHWMAFYVISFAMALAALRQPASAAPPKAPVEERVRATLKSRAREVRRTASSPIDQNRAD